MMNIDVNHGKNKTLMNPVDDFVCSECNFEMCDYVEVVTVNEDNPPDNYYREFIPKYCPNCGAKMDEE